MLKFREERRKISHLGIRNARALNKIIGDRLSNLSNQLTEALPEDLRAKYGHRNGVTDIVWNGGHTFTVMADVGLKPSDEDIQRMCKEALVELEPVCKAWVHFGVVLKKIEHCYVNNGLIEAKFVVK